ncbi:MAG: hypothetical protein KGO50_07120 [Myxococcales bacterium]|nr:hypothetical protein [Myxococcales bacterium]
MSRSLSVAAFLLSLVCASCCDHPDEYSCAYDPYGSALPEMPPPIQHPVSYHAQDTMAWCWVAAAKMMVEYYTGQAAPDQCQMLEAAYGAPCCSMTESCTRTGHISEIQGLIHGYSGLFTTVAPPVTAVALYDLLTFGPLVIHTNQGAGHFVVATGMWFMSSPAGPVAMVQINDPYFGQYEVDYPSLASSWTVVLHAM